MVRKGGVGARWGGLVGKCAVGWCAHWSRPVAARVVVVASTKSEVGTTPALFGGHSSDFRGDGLVIIVRETGLLRHLGGNFDTPAKAHPDSSNDTDDADKELGQCRGSLVNLECDWINVILEEDAWCSLTMRELLDVVGNRVLVGVQWLGARGDIGGRNDRDKVLKCDKMFLGRFKRIVQRLDNIGIVWPKRKLGDDVGHVNVVMASMGIVSSVSVAEGGNMEIACELSYRKASIDTARSTIWSVIPGRTELRTRSLEHGEETTGAPRGSYNLAGGKYALVFLKFVCLANVKECAVPHDSVAQMETVTNGVTKIDAQDGAGRINDEVDVDFEEPVLVRVNGKFIVAPAPDKLSNVVEDEEKGESDDEEGHEATKLCARLVGRGELWKCIKLLYRSYFVELVEQRRVIVGRHLANVCQLSG